MAVNIAGLVIVVILYLAILVVGIWAAWRNRKKGGNSRSEIIMVARRDIGFLLGSFTITGM